MGQSVQDTNFKNQDLGANAKLPNVYHCVFYLEITKISKLNLTQPARCGNILIINKGWTHDMPLDQLVCVDACFSAPSWPGIGLIHL